jgi:hypothetical protein
VSALMGVAALALDEELPSSARRSPLATAAR